MRDFENLFECRVRFAKLKDLDALYHLAQEAKTGLTSLPKDKALLENKLQESQDNHLQKIKKPSGELYLFVIEHLPSKQIVGTSNILSQIGVERPFYQYRVFEESRHTATLGKTVNHQYLVLDKSHKKSTEIGGLFLLPLFRQKGVGRLLSLSRLMYMAVYRQRFMDHVIAEMRGVGHSETDIPFWDGLARYFFGCPFIQADQLSVYSPRFIEDLLPEYPINIRLLPKKVQHVIGQVHHQTRPALKLLLSEHFQFSNCVDIMDGGPKIECELQKIRTIQKARKMTLKAKRSIPVDQLEVCMVWVPDDQHPEVKCIPLRRISETQALYPEKWSHLMQNKRHDGLWVSPLYPVRRRI